MVEVNTTFPLQTPANIAPPSFRIASLYPFISAENSFLDLHSQKKGLILFSSSIISLFWIGTDNYRSITSVTAYAYLKLNDALYLPMFHHVIHRRIGREEDQYTSGRTSGDID